jgi:uncharacterized protein YqgC (DUF456 family)
VVAILVYLLVLLVSLAGVALNVFSLPGNWLMMVAAALFSWWTHWSHPPVWVLGAMVGVLLVGEAVELLGSVVGAKKFGASRGATWAAIGGAILGAIVGVPVPVIGNILGAIVGAFVFAWTVELAKRRGMKAATLAAVGAALGRTMGIGAKLACGIMVWVALVIFAWPR